MFVRLEKISPEKRQRRFYVMNVARTLFGEWCLIREWGRIGTAGGQRMVNYTASIGDAEAALARLCQQKYSRGYRWKAGATLDNTGE